MWSTLLLFLLLIASFGILVPMAVWSLECAAALLPPRKRAQLANTLRPAIAVLVPAHNESSVIRHTLASLAPQILPGDRVVVIADNCSDDTADIARQAGSLVLERHDPERRGKSYALDYAVRSLDQSMPDVFVVIDADCIAHPGALDQLARLAFSTNRPVQANYLMELPANPSPLQPIAALAFRIRNFVRPSGLDRLGLACFLNGSGMAFPAPMMQNMVWASGRIAEDRWLTVELLLAGHAAAFCREAKVTSRLPGQKLAEISQSTRWLHGHLECMRVKGPRLLLGAIRQRRLDLFALLLDLLVPPLSLLMMLWLAVLSATVVAGLLGLGWLPVIPAAAGGLLMALSLGGVMLRFEETSVAQALWAVPFYIVSKLPIYAAFIVRREKNWVRTGRDPIPPPE